MVKRTINCAVIFGESGATIEPANVNPGGRQGEINAVVVNYAISGLGITSGTAYWRAETVDSIGIKYSSEVTQFAAGNTLNINYNIPAAALKNGGKTETVILISVANESAETAEMLITPPLKIWHTNIKAATLETVTEQEEEEINAVVAQIINLKNDAETAKTGAETAKAGAETAKTGAETAKAGAETAKAGAETAKTGAETAKDTVLNSLTQYYTKPESDGKYLTEHQDISGKADKATTIAGYGITNAFTKAETNSAISSAITNAITSTLSAEV